MYICTCSLTLNHAIKFRYAPTQWLREKFPYALEGALAPPVSVRSVAIAAVNAATRPEYDGKFTVIDNDQMLAIEA